MILFPQEVVCRDAEEFRDPHDHVEGGIIDPDLPIGDGALIDSELLAQLRLRQARKFPEIV